MLKASVLSQTNFQNKLSLGAATEEAELVVNDFGITTFTAACEF